MNDIEARAQASREALESVSRPYERFEVTEETVEQFLGLNRFYL